jgi:putative hydrolase of the HAD superfamily
VDRLVVSEEAGASKPDPRIFEIALARAGCAAEEAVMVGDSWTNDILGARAAGIRAIWFDRDARDPPLADVPVIRSLQPASDVLRTIFAEATTGAVLRR